LLGEIDYELGVIAGSRSIDPISSWMIGKPNDGKVSIESTKIAGMKDHAVIPVAHTFFTNNRAARYLTLHFLKHAASSHYNQCLARHIKCGALSNTYD